MYHAGCSYCEHRCKYYDKIKDYIDKRVAVNKVLEKLKSSNFSAKHIHSFLNSNIVSDLNINNIFQKICLIGYILDMENELNNGRRQKIIADYINKYFTI